MTHHDQQETRTNPRRIVRARDLIWSSTRFDLVPKFLYAEAYLDGNVSSYRRALYLSSIYAMNRFQENSPAKRSPTDFIEAFESLLLDLKENGYQPNGEVLPVDGRGLNPVKGAHRTAGAAALGLSIPVSEARDAPDVTKLWDYRSRAGSGLDAKDRDQIALIFCMISPSAQVLLVHSCVPDFRSPDGSEPFDEIVRKHTRVYYRKDINLSITGYTNLKLLNYGADQRHEWLGSIDDGFNGAREHAVRSMGESPLRLYVLVAGDDAVLSAKKELREAFGLGNYAAHSTETKRERDFVAQALLNDHSRELLNTLPFHRIEQRVRPLLQAVSSGVDCGLFCSRQVVISGSSTLALYTDRKPTDVDLLGASAVDYTFDGIHVGDHDSQADFYPCGFTEIADNPENHVWYGGFRFAALPVIHSMKRQRRSEAKDAADVHLIEQIWGQFGHRSSHYRRLLSALRARSVRSIWALRIRVRQLPFARTTYRIIRGLFRGSNAG